MGTSKSSSGPPSSGPMVPPWADAPVPGAGGDGSVPPDAPAQPSAPVPTAQSQRWVGTRRSLGDFARNGDGRALKRGVKQYVRSGYGGAATAARRMSSTGATASALGMALAGLSGGGGPGVGAPLERQLLAGRSIEEIMDRVVDAVRPVDGTQDAEASRAAIRDALSELLTHVEDADLLNLTVDQQAFAVEKFAAFDVFRRFELDVGQHIIKCAPTTAEGLARLKEAKDYIKETVSAAFRKLGAAGKGLTDASLASLVRNTLKEAFEVFEAYME